MVETARAHTRIPPEEVPLRTIDAGLPVSLFIAESAAPGDLDLLIHFMGAEYVPVHAVRTSGTHAVLAVVNLGSGSSAFERPFREEARLRGCWRQSRPPRPWSSGARRTFAAST
jgi:hypothetical protein